MLLQVKMFAVAFSIPETKVCASAVIKRQLRAMQQQQQQPVNDCDAQIGNRHIGAVFIR